MESYAERQQFKQIIAGLALESDTAPADGWDTTPRPLGIETTVGDNLPLGHIALRGDFDPRTE